MSCLCPLADNRECDDQIDRPAADPGDGGASDPAARSARIAPARRFLEDRLGSLRAVDAGAGFSRGVVGHAIAKSCFSRIEARSYLEAATSPFALLAGKVARQGG